MKKLQRIIGSASLSYSWSLAFTVVGTAGLAAIGIESFRDHVRAWFPSAVWQWGADNVVVVVAILAFLAIYPAQYSVGSRRLDQRESDQRTLSLDTKKQVELTTLARGLSSRVAHLITKAGDVRAGEVNNRYLSHTLAEAAGYFMQRALYADDGDASDRIELVLYRANWASNGRHFFERELQTHMEVDEFAYKLTSHQNPSGATFIGKLANSDGFYVATPEELEELAKAFGITSPVPFKQFVGVPVRENRKGSGQSNITGLLLMMSTRENMLRITDMKLLAPYTWFVSAAKQLDQFR